MRLLKTMYPSLQLPWSANPSTLEQIYKASGCVKTRGTLFLLPPTPEELKDTYNSPPRPKTMMSSGAVALCKHFERGGASSEHGRPHPFWPLPKGSNENKTAVASKVLEDMLNDTQWKNVMLLHPGVAVYEIRNSGGYGMRWTLQIAENTENKTCEILKTTFRGFLEPIEDIELD